MIQKRDKDTGKILKKTNTEFIRELKKNFQTHLIILKLIIKALGQKLF